MKELLRSTDISLIAFAKAMLSSRDIEVFELDVNMSTLEGGIGAFPRRLMVHEDDFDAAVVVCEDLQISRA